MQKIICKKSLIDKSNPPKNIKNWKDKFWKKLSSKYLAIV